MCVRRAIVVLSVLLPIFSSTVLLPAAAHAAVAVQVKSSSGCGTENPPLQNGQTVNFSAAGEAGSYIEEGPSGGSGNNPLPLVIDLHGYSETAAIQVAFTKLGSYGISHDFLTVSPQVNEQVQHWITSPGSSDQEFLIALIAHLEQTLCVNTQRVYVVGYSNGAFMASALACSDANKIAAVATVAGIEATKSCHPSRRVPVIAFHGTADPFVPYNGGIGPAAKKLPAVNGSGSIGSNVTTKADQGIEQNDLPIPVEESRWAARNGCSKSPKTSTVATGVTLIAYSCPNNASVELYRENGDGHIWAGSDAMVSIASIVGKTTFAISANQLIWKFFESHPM
jgi:polyhydroxybutyrate depolymerase